ncbi:helix-turn-helix domain-containing protein [Streptomyces sp. NBC_00237]|uniref:IclR family transcriptional regulator domain-containing protein n=1 Tax=Streptomyces sp. NBC_00237 TaxID=2975687 RepID=UPI00224D9789|nr:IclR family transcriptional regulator C-terminal domain-containing protein [Streptomyces sp. NBC_00237]MCX5202833.1 helix-turn-helix domain-containing protein [Streptomyces sp. NBC_00237]
MPDTNTTADDALPADGGPAVGGPADDLPAEAVGPLLRGVDVLRRLTDAGGRLSPGDLVRSTGLARSTVDRVTQTLARMGYLRLDGRDAALTPRLMELGNAYLAALRVPGLLGPHAEHLADALDESVSLAVPDRDGIRFVHQSTRRRAMSLSFRIGDLLPAERTAPGALFATDWDEAAWARWRKRRTADPQGLGFLAVPPLEDTPDEAHFAERTRWAREQGWALDDQLIEPGLVALALPVRDAAGRPVCAVSVVSHTSRHSAASLRKTVLPQLRLAVGEMEKELRESPVEEAVTSPAPLASWTSASKQELGAGFVESLARGLTVLTAFGAGRPELTLTGVAQACGLARATARRALITFVHLGYVEARDGMFRPTPRVLGLGFPPLSRLSLPQIAEPHLAALAQRVHDSTSLSVLTGTEIQYTARVATSRVMNVNITVGTRFPAYATSMGRVLLADLPEGERAALLAASAPQALTPRTRTSVEELTALLEQVREDRYAMTDGELEEGLRSVAVPVRDRTGVAVAAVNVAMHSSRRTAAEVRTEVLPALRSAVAGIEGDLAQAGRFTRTTAC